MPRDQSRSEQVVDLADRAGHPLLHPHPEHLLDLLDVDEVGHRGHPRAAVDAFEGDEAGHRLDAGGGLAVVAGEAVCELEAARLVDRVDAPPAARLLAGGAGHVVAHRPVRSLCSFAVAPRELYQGHRDAVALGRGLALDAPRVVGFAEERDKHVDLRHRERPVREPRAEVLADAVGEEHMAGRDVGDPERDLTGGGVRELAHRRGADAARHRPESGLGDEPLWERDRGGGGCACGDDDGGGDGRDYGELDHSVPPR